MKKNIALILAFFSLFFVFSAPATAEDAVRIATLRGPTGMGMAQMMAENDGSYVFTLASAPDELAGGIISGNIDIAAIPTNLAAVLYQKTKGGVSLLAINTLGVLYVMEKGDSVHTVADLAGKTVMTSGQGATPEYILNYLLEQNAVTGVMVEYKSEHNEVATLAASGMADLVMLPEPFVTSLLMRDAGFRIALDVTVEFASAAKADGYGDAVLPMGCVAVRTEFLKAHPDKVTAFMAACAASVDYANSNIPEASAMMEAQGILPKAAVAALAIPTSHLVYITGETMKTQAARLYEILLAANPASVGGKLPDDTFYYIP
jgi:NitT/TauT family transport system substrate-binding protein